jgi:hypothetical protein
MSDHCTLRAKVRKTGSTSAGIVPGSVLAGKLSVSTMVPILFDTLNIDAVGELVGSHGSPPPQQPSQVDIGGGGTGPAAASSAAHNEKNYLPFDAASIGSLISEVTGDYRRMGKELFY